MSKRDDLIRLHKAAVEAKDKLAYEAGVAENSRSFVDIPDLYEAWRDAENAFMRVAEKVTNE